MKSTVLIWICFFVAFSASAKEPTPKKKILVVGFSNSYFNSNSYEKLAKSNNTSENSLYSFINSRLLLTFNERLNSNFDFTTVKESGKFPLKSLSPIHYLMHDAEKELTAVKITDYDLKKLGEYYDADIILFINSYELNWEDDPYLAYLHSFDCEVFTKSGDKSLQKGYPS